jgi:hypothetical protein
MTPLNPYAPPVATGPGFPMQTAPGAFRIEGDKLVIAKEGALPPLCIWNGEPAADGYVQRKLTWVPPWTGAFVISPIIYLIVFLIVKKTGGLRFALGQTARKRRKSGILILVSGMLVGIGVMIAGIAIREPIGMLVGIVLLFVGLLVGALRARTMQIVKIDKTHIYLKLPPAALRAFVPLA